MAREKFSVLTNSCSFLNFFLDSRNATNFFRLFDLPPIGTQEYFMLCLCPRRHHSPFLSSSHLPLTLNIPNPHQMRSTGFRRRFNMVYIISRCTLCSLSYSYITTPPSLTLTLNYIQVFGKHDSHHTPSFHTLTSPSHSLPTK